ncbi:anti-sigma regulatory factor (Ser/Thr protein kinase) [Isoptericola sp. CG 20/1183]|uniref:Anti-sigma regulatory factor (Ser/Thr protein kinase) n=1 Tax=Isoptericola halotolerans TaxID=300560 RepID=A0ABX5EM30_9MICO|nr:MULTISPECIES: ATP-binding protein [Isoptericola]PRZ09573.1 anti-sigma regulatory factor (Ser/Thr protein kinase) [Isoptericola sp. CG 20/1183]PRZ10374.1 anti-sigma regulatory factor (Ser/Thr protein kinase) [Isoptericola halotolerans]
MTLVEALPEATLTEVAAWTVRDLDHVSDVRAGLQETLVALTAAAGADPPGGAGGPALDRIVLVASELVTNAVRYGSQPVTLRLLQHGATLAVDVVDHRPDLPPVPGTGGSGEGGLGLLLAARAAAGIGWFRSQGAKHVWAQFA